MFRRSNRVFLVSVLDVSDPSSFLSRFLHFFRGDFVVESNFRFLVWPGSNFRRFFFFFDSSPSPVSKQTNCKTVRCLHNKAPKYLTVCCVAVSDIAGRQRLRSAHRRQLDVPRYRRTTLGRRAFSVAGPTVWNLLPDELREETENTFRLSLKTLLFRQY